MSSATSRRRPHRRSERPHTGEQFASRREVLRVVAKRQSESRRRQHDLAGAGRRRHGQAEEGETLPEVALHENRYVLSLGNTHETHKAHTDKAQHTNA